MSLTPTATVTLGNLRYDSHISDLVASLALLPGVNTFCVNLPSGVEISATIDDPATVELDGGEGAETVLTGKLRSIRQKLLSTEVAVADAGADLGEFRPAATYERQSAKDVIRSLATDIGVSVGIIDLDLPLAAYLAHQGCTAAEHVAYLAKLAGATAKVDANGDLLVTLWPGSEPDAVLLYGREIIDYTAWDRPGPQVRRVALGNGPAGTTEAPEALRQSSNVLPSDAPAAGANAVWKAVPILRTPAAALTASQAVEKQAASWSSRVRARCFLLPALRPGMVIEVQELPNGMSGGPWLLTHVTHRLRPGLGGITTLAGVSAKAGGLGALLGGALSAAGGLL